MLTLIYWLIHSRAFMEAKARISYMVEQKTSESCLFWKH